MNSIILCEGSSDFVLLQYYMRTVYGWTDARTQESIQLLSHKKFSDIITLNIKMID